MSLSHSPKIVTDGLVIYLDAGNSRSYPGSGATWSSLIGTDVATLTNGPTYSLLGGGSILFDGTDDYVIGNTSSFPSVLPFTSISWFRLNVINKEQHFFNLKGNIQFYSSTTNRLATFNYGAITGSTTLQANTWYMGAMTQDASGNGILYLNGKQDGSGALPSYSTVTQFVGGNFVGGGNYYLNGYLSIGMFYTKALSATEIAQNFNALRGRFGI